MGRGATLIIYGLYIQSCRFSSTGFKSIYRNFLNFMLTLQPVILPVSALLALSPPNFLPPLADLTWSWFLRIPSTCLSWPFPLIPSNTYWLQELAEGRKIWLFTVWSSMHWISCWSHFYWDRMSGSLYARNTCSSGYCLLRVENCPVTVWAGCSYFHLLLLQNFQF